MKQLFKISIIGLFVIIVSCRNEKKEYLNINKKSEAFRFPVIIDTSTFSFFKREATWISTANYELLYIGKWKDTIYPDYGLKYYPIQPFPSDFEDTFDYQKIITKNKMYLYYVDWLAPKKYKHWNMAKISIVVDTTQRVKNDDILAHSDDLFFEAYPVLIENLDIDTIKIGYGHFLPLITEAKDSSGNWRPIEKDWNYVCGNGVGTIILPPKEIGLSATMIYHGNYSTTLRLRIDSNISNEFIGTINYRQFESKFDEQGEYKDEYKRK